MAVKKTKKTIKHKPKKKPVLKPSKTKAAQTKKRVKKSIKATKKSNVIGKVTHYFSKVRAAVIKLDKPLSVGDTIKIKGHTTDFTQQINSMQIDRVPVNTAKKGNEIGLLVESRVREHDIVYKP